MAKEYSRTQRIGDQMQRELAQLIRREVKDPRVVWSPLLLLKSAVTSVTPRSSSP